MKFTVSSSDLLKKIQKAGGAISSNPVLPILEDFLFTVKGNRLKITATDLETTIITNMEIASEDEGEVAIPGKTLSDTLKELPDQPITFEVDEQSNNIEIQSAYGVYKLAGLSGDDYPKIPEMDDVNEITIDSSRFLRGLSTTAFATSNDEIRPAMMGVLCEIESNKINLVATDAHKLVKYSFQGNSNGAFSSFIIPKKSVSLLKNLLPSDTELKIAYNKANAFFVVEDDKLICRLIDAVYPDYNAVIPSDNNSILQVGNSEFRSALRRIAVYANKTTNQVLLNISEDNMEISAEDVDFSNEAKETQKCIYAGDPMQIGFNAKFLIEMLGAIGSEQILLKLDSPNRAGIMVPNEQDEGEDLMMLVMPVMINY